MTILHCEFTHPASNRDGELPELREQAPLVFIHGVGMNADNWQAQKDYFSPKLPCCFIDLPGHGKSGLADSFDSAASVGVQEYANEIAHFLLSRRELTTRPLVLVGHSLGALIGVRLAANDRLNLRAFVGVSTVFGRSEHALALVRERAKEISIGNHNLNHTATLSRWFDEDASQVFRHEREACLSALQSIELNAYAAAYSAFANTTGADADLLKQISYPCFYITGSDDPNSTPSMSVRLADATPRADSFIVDGAKHMVHMTHALDFNERLSQWLEQQKITW